MREKMASSFQEAIKMAALPIEKIDQMSQSPERLACLPV